MTPIKDATPFLRHIEELNRHDPANFVPWYIANRMAGLIRRDFVKHIARFPQTFSIAESRIDMIRGADEAERSAILNEICMALEAEGCFGLRAEPYRIVEAWGKPSMGSIDRGACQFFGTRAFGVHINGFVRRGLDYSMWIGQRALDRLVSPGKLDHLVGGGLSADMTVAGTVMKEGQEEAGMDAALAARALPCGFVSYVQDAATGIKRDMLFVHDLELPPDFVPHNEDGEVERFTLMPMEEVAEIVAANDAFKPNCNLVVIDFLVRHGLIQPDCPGYEALVLGLRRWHATD